MADNASPLKGLLANGNTVLQAIVAAELLAPPVALREDYSWNQPPNEPSTSQR